MQPCSFRVLELPQSEATPTMPSTLARPPRESKWSAGRPQGPYPRSMSSSRQIGGRSAGRPAWLGWPAAAHERGSDRPSVKSSRSFTSKSSRSSQAAELAALGEMRRQSYAQSVEQSPVVNQMSPMFVLPVKDVIGLDGLRTHEELQAMGKLVEWEDGMGDVMFVSQTWLRKEHPDDEQGSKFELLKVLRLVIA